MIPLPLASKTPQPPCDILYEDNHIIVAVKPAGLLTQPTSLESNSLELLLKQYLKEKYQKPGEAFLGIVHRLDRPVSGIVLFAKTSKALARLNAAMRERAIHKTYDAIVDGCPPHLQGTLEHYLVHDDFFAKVSTPSDKEAKHAKLDYAVVESITKNSRPFSRLKIVLHTGRYHQIRAQLAFIGCPIFGDVKYGSSNSLGSHQIALHHGHLAMHHPVTKERMEFTAPFLPPPPAPLISAAWQP